LLLSCPADKNPRQRAERWLRAGRRVPFCSLLGFWVVVSFKSDGVAFLCQVGRDRKTRAFPRDPTSCRGAPVPSLPGWWDRFPAPAAPHVRDRFRAARLRPRQGRWAGARGRRRCPGAVPAAACPGATCASADWTTIRCRPKTCRAPSKMCDSPSHAVKKGFSAKSFVAQT